MVNVFSGIVEFWAIGFFSQIVDFIIVQFKINKLSKFKLSDF